MIIFVQGNPVCGTSHVMAGFLKAETGKGRKVYTDLPVLFQHEEIKNVSDISKLVNSAFGFDYDPVFIEKNGKFSTKRDRMLSIANEAVSKNNIIFATITGRIELVDEFMEHCHVFIICDPAINGLIKFSMLDLDTNKTREMTVDVYVDKLLNYIPLPDLVTNVY